MPIHKMFNRLLVLATGLLVLTACFSLTGCTNPGDASVHSSTTFPRLAPSTSPSPISSYPIYNGEIVPPLAGEGPDDIWVINYDCAPNVLTVMVGTTVTWTNLDFKPFVVVSDGGLFSGYLQAHGGTWSYRFDNPGDFGYSIDPYNDETQGIIIVKAA